MLKGHRAFAVVVCGAVLAATAGGVRAESWQRNSISTSGANMLKLAVERPMPTYPPESLRAGRQGVVVTEIRVGDGRMRSVTVLQAPDDRVAAEVTKALMQWTFRPIYAPGGAQAIVRSKLVFYFAIREGRGLVLTFQEMAELRRSEERLGAATAVEPDYPAIDEDQWRRLAAATKPVLLDIQHREDFARGHLPGAVNIPVNELYYRIPSELFRARALVVDCPQSVAKLCPGAAFHLARAGFTKVSILHR